jgi:hypothetical protein
MKSLAVSSLGGARATATVHPNLPDFASVGTTPLTKAARSTPPLARHRVDLASLPVHNRHIHLLERLDEMFRRLGTGQSDLPVHDEERHPRHAEAACLLLTSPHDVQPLVPRQQIEHWNEGEV